MAKEVFLKTDPENQKDIYRAMSERLGKSEQILEKDVWVCLVLDALFSMPDALRMAFKGGTSLSKAYSLIDRFSEDIDVTIDFRDFIEDDPYKQTSKSKIKKMREKLETSLQQYIESTILPNLKAKLPNAVGCPIEIKIAGGHKVEIHYQPACVQQSEYIKPFVLLEFGARNVTVPSSLRRIIPYISKEVPSLQFPSATVNVYALERTFWEKITMMHVECNRGKFKSNADRLSRHWYDVVILYLSGQVLPIVENKYLLKEVVEHKTVFFPESYAKYEKCLGGDFNLIPQGEQLEELKKDYENMVNSGMFHHKPHSFKELMSLISELQIKLSA